MLTGSPADLKSQASSVGKELIEAAIPKDISSKEAIEAITAINEALKPLGIKPNDQKADLARTGIGYYWGKLISGQVLDLREALHYFVETSLQANQICANDFYLNEAIQILKKVIHDLAQYMSERAQESTGDKEFTYVLLNLYSGLFSLLKKLGENPATLTDACVKQCKSCLDGMASAFSVFASKTADKSSKHQRRMEISHRLKTEMLRLDEPLRLFMAKKPLQDRLKVLENTTGLFARGMQRVMLGVILVHDKEASKPPSRIWTDMHRIALEASVGMDIASIPQHLRQSKQETLGTVDSKGVLFSNPFHARTQELVTVIQAAKAAEQKKVQQWNKKAVYLNVIDEVFAAIGSASDIEKVLEQNRARYFAASGHFNLLGRLLKSPVTTESEWNFIRTTALLLRQGYEFARFMHHLNEFMMVVGMLGLHHHFNLHKSLLKIITHAQDRFGKNIEAWQKQVLDRVPPSQWLYPLHEMVEAVQRQGRVITDELLSFKVDFEKISDKREMQIKFETARDQLFAAATGLASASGVEADDLIALTDQIKHVKFSHFTVVSDSHALALAGDSLATNVKLSTDLITAQADLKQSNDLIQRTAVEMQQIKVELATTSARLTKEATDAKHTLEELDKLVETFHASQQKRFDGLREQFSKDSKEIDAQIARIDSKNPPLTDTQKSEILLQLSEKKGQLMSYRDVYDGLLKELNAFISQYREKNKNMAAKLTAIESLTGDVQYLIGTLATKIDFLNKQVEALKKALEEQKAHMEREMQRQRADFDAQLRAAKEALAAAQGKPKSLDVAEVVPAVRKQPLGCAVDDVKATTTHQGFFPDAKDDLNKFDLKAVQGKIHLYETEIDSTMVWNKSRKAIKWAVWSQIQRLMAQPQQIKGNVIDHALDNFWEVFSSDKPIQIRAFNVKAIISEKLPAAAHKNKAAVLGVVKAEFLAGTASTRTQQAVDLLSPGYR